MKAGDKVEVDGETWEVAHVSPKIDENCDHDWVENDEDGTPEYCKKCNLSFIRYIHSIDF